MVVRASAAPPADKEEREELVDKDVEYAEEPKPSSGGGMSWQRAAATMIAEIVGTGVLGLGYAAARVGWGLALSFLLVFGLASLFSSMLLASIHREHPEVESYQAVAALVGGPRARRWTAVAVNMSWLFVCPYYLMASAHSLAVSFWWRQDVCYYQWALLSIAAVAVPAQVRSFEGISSLSAASVAAVAVALVVMGIQFVAGGVRDGGEPAAWAPPNDMTVWLAFDSISATTFAYQGQSMLLEIAHEMENPRRDFALSIFAAGFGLIALYAGAMFLGYHYRGATVAGFLPDSLADGPAKTLVGLLLFFHVAVTYLVNNQPLSKKIYEFAYGDLKRSQPRAARRWAAISGTLLVWSYLIANLIPWFSAFQALMGSLLGAPIMFGFPVAFYVLDERQRQHVVGHFPTRAALAVVGGLVLPATLVVGTVAAFVGLAAEWGEGGMFQCTPGGYGR
mmetsp:Transcript_9563/g.28983  ORF Transcript_9563/g.28983 Transcript_9563/m.28983 type:complete len:451 (-) Transcript_9563:16-1368(-)